MPKKNAEIGVNPIDRRESRVKSSSIAVPSQCRRRRFRSCQVFRPQILLPPLPPAYAFRRGSAAESGILSDDLSIRESKR
jgi:hypothetical protein